MRRRQFLAAVPAATAICAGCVGRSDTAPRPRLDALWFVNESDEACDASVTVELGGDTVYENSFRLGSATTDADFPSNRTWKPSLDGPGAYVVRATVADETVTVDATEWVDGDETCLVLKFVQSVHGDLHSRPKAYQDC